MSWLGNELPPMQSPTVYGFHLNTSVSGSTPLFYDICMPETSIMYDVFFCLISDLQVFFFFPHYPNVRYPFSLLLVKIYLCRVNQFTLVMLRK